VNMRKHEAQASGADGSRNASQDAGWVHLVSADGKLDFGRGHLKMWVEPPGSKVSNGRQAQLDSFSPSSLEPRQGERAGVRPEAESAVYPVLIRQYDRLEDTAAVMLDWLDEGALPATLLETGGEHSGESSSRVPS
jgi:hypothetical protein